MKYAKGTIFEVYDELYMLAGKLYVVNESYVLIPQDDGDIEVLIYTEDEIEEGLEEGWLTLKK
jgi:hypothetical protein